MITKIIVLVIGIALISFISWWFFGKHDKEPVAAQVKLIREFMPDLKNIGNENINEIQNLALIVITQSLPYP